MNHESHDETLIASPEFGDRELSTGRSSTDNGELHFGLDSSGEESVNQSDVIGGTHAMNPVIEPEPHITTIEGLEHLMKAPAVPRRNADGRPRRPKAVVYLRVSTPRQMNTAADVDEDGNSIATQREWTTGKARELGAEIVAEFVEPGQSAQTIAKRTEFKRLLRFIDEHPGVTHLIIYMRSRVFRNFTDAAITKRGLLQKGVRLISAKEQFGDGYMGDAMEAITDIMNEVQVRQNGEDVATKMEHKIQQGGSIGRAKIGYLNVRKDYGGVFVNTIEVDSLRSPLVVWAFEQYATGEYSIAQLTSLLEEQGLRTRPSRHYPEQRLSKSRVAKMLRDPYYTGVNRYKGKLYGGRHEPLITKSLFLDVQKILDQRNRHGERDRIHFHYLKGQLYCGHCEAEGRSSRLVFTQHTGNGGTYDYFVCTGKLRGLCSMGVIRLELLERRVTDAVAVERLGSDTVERMRDTITSAIDDLLTGDREMKANLRRQLKKLEAQEERLIDLAADGTLAVPTLKARLEKTMFEKDAVQEKLSRTQERLIYGAEKAIAYIDLLENPGELYQNAPEDVRRDLLEALFSRLVVVLKDHDLTIYGERNEANQAARQIASQVRLSNDTTVATREQKIPGKTAEDLSIRAEAQFTHAHGSNKNNPAGVPGLEPRTTEPESAVLPITPYPKGVRSRPEHDHLPYRIAGHPNKTPRRNDP